MVLPRIAQHGGHYAPTVYTVWYEHVAGMNPPLSRELQTLIEAGQPIGVADFDRLHAAHVSGQDTTAMGQLQQDFGQLLQRVAGVVASAGEGVDQQSAALAAVERDLGSVRDAGDLARIVRALVETTAAARSNAERLRGEVEASRSEVQQLREHLGALQNEASTDPLPGLLNRRGLEREFARRYEGAPAEFERCGVLIADIDHFKHITDNYGHLFGDQVIRACAQAITQVVKGRDLVARFGGEEFLILLPETPRGGAMTLAEQVRAAFAKVRIRRAGSSEYVDKVTLSVGVAMPLPGEGLEAAVARADAALYKAKYAGRNRVCMAEVEPLGLARPASAG